MPSADHIATFVEVVRQRSLSAAARRAGLPKSTISRRLARLEQQLHSKLLHRDARKLTLTPAGQRFYASVAGPVDALSAAIEAHEQSDQQPRGTIRLTAPADLGRMVLAPMLVAFLERHAEIALELTFTNRFLDLAVEGIDLAIRAGRVIEGDLIARKLCDSELQLAAAASRPRFAAEDDPRELLRQPFVLYRAAGGSQLIRLERSSGRRAKALELTASGRVSVDDYAALAELVAAGKGLGLLPALHVRDGVAAGRLRRVCPAWSSRSAHV